MMTTFVLDRAALRRIVEQVGLDTLMDRTIHALTEALHDYDEQRIEQRERDGFVCHTPHLGVLEWMPVMEHGVSAVIKLVGYNPSNARAGLLPTVISTIHRYDPTTGQLLALCDGTFATALRTGAASAIASRVLARPRAQVLGVIGCGAQAVTQIHALSRVFPLTRVLAYDVVPKTARSLAVRAGIPGVEIRAVERAVVEREAQILCTTTSVAPGAGPVLDGGQLREDLHINAVGSDLPGKVELPHELLLRATVVPDFAGQALREGECQQLEPSQIGPNLFELVRAPERYAPQREQLTVFDSTGLPLEDAVVSELLVDIGRELGVGHEIEIEAIADDPLDPYGFCSGQGRQLVQVDGSGR